MGDAIKNSVKNTGRKRAYFWIFSSDAISGAQRPEKPPPRSHALGAAFLADPFRAREARSSP